MSGNLSHIKYEEPKVKESVIVPEALYAAKVISAEDKISSGGGEHVLMTFAILDPEYKNAIASDKWWVYGGSDGAIKRTDDIVNQMRKASKKLEAENAADFIGDIVTIRVKTGTWNSHKKNEVAWIESIDNHPELLEKAKSFNDDIPF